MVCNGVVSYENHKTGLTAEENKPTSLRSRNARPRCARIGVALYPCVALLLAIQFACTPLFSSPPEGRWSDGLNIGMLSIC